jgi:hypothetical protein
MSIRKRPSMTSRHIARDVAEGAVRTVHEAANRGDAFAAITVFGFVACKLGAPD